MAARAANRRLNRRRGTILVEDGSCQSPDASVESIVSLERRTGRLQLGGREEWRALKHRSTPWPRFLSGADTARHVGLCAEGEERCRNVSMWIFHLEE